MATYQFGVVSALGTSMGLVQSVTKNVTSSEALAIDEVGEVADATYYRTVIDASIECVYDTGATLPDINDDITIGSDTYQVTGVTQNETNSDYMKVTITGKHFVAITT
jgi:hypothetical protein